MFVYRGTKITSRLSNYYPDRFTAFAFLAMPYLAPSPQFDMEEVLATTKKMVGYELYGYWKFLSEGEHASIWKAQHFFRC